MESMEALSAPAPAYQGLIYNLFQQPREQAEGGLVICFTSAGPGEGVTHVIRALANDLGEHSPHRVVRVDLSYLQTQRLPAPKASPDRGNLAELSAGAKAQADPGVRSHWHGSWQYRLERVNELRSQFEYVLIDCPSLRTSGDVLSVAPLADGVILVVEADRTTRDQIAHAEKQIQAAGGKFSGCILNKRKYIVPQWIYRHL